MRLDKYPPPVYPTVDEHHLLPDTIDFNISNNPEQPFYIFSESPNDISVITHLEFGRAVNRVAHIVRPHRAGPNGEVVAILAQTDTILYQAIVAGLIYAGLVPFPISSRNTSLAVAELLVQTSCHRLLTTIVPFEPLIKETKAHLANRSHEIEITEIPSLAAIYPQLTHEVSEYLFERYPASSQRPSASDTCIIVHSSGSTGTPRAIRQTHLHWIQSVISRASQGYLTRQALELTFWLIFQAELKEYAPRLVLGCMALPSFHAFGVGTQIFTPAYGVLCIALCPPMTGASGGSPMIPSPDNVLAHAKLTKTNAMFIVPAFVQMWSTSPDAVNYLKELEFLIYSGGPLPPKLGNNLTVAGVNLHAIYGSTEVAGPVHLVPGKGENMDWEYVRFYPHTRTRWIPQGDGTFECQFLACNTHRPVFSNLPDVEGYATADIFEPHPTKEGLWKIVGRADDVIIHSSGEKTVPGPIEVVVTSNPLVQAAIVFGREREQAGVLIELRVQDEIDVEDPVEVAQKRNEIWQTVEEANSRAPTHSKIFKEMILFVSKNKSLPRAGKGTVMRKAALNLYASEISALYENVDAGVIDHSYPSSWSTKNVEDWIMQQAIELTSVQVISPDSDLFDQGFDSLSATILRRRITTALRSSNDPSMKAASRNVPQNLVYNTPTIKGLIAYMLLTSEPGLQPSQRIKAIEELITKYGSNFLPQPTSISAPIKKSVTTILLTGSTGQLGSQILAHLLLNTRVEKVYAFNRPGQNTSTLLDRHIEKFRDIGLDSSLLKSEKLVLISGDASKSDLGIQKELYDEISSSIDVVIHSAWHLDFNLPLMSYEPYIKSTRNLVDFVSTSPNASRARFLFISSIASAQSWHDSRGPVPEDVLDDTSVALGGGYGEGKYVVERILAGSGLRATALRLGQVCGGRPKGSWPTTEWFPILVKSSIALRAYPLIDEITSWIPSDTAARAIMDISLQPPESELPRVLNLVHTRPVEQTVICAGIFSAIKEYLSLDLSLVSYHEWVSIVEEQAEKATLDTLTTIPAIKLTEFLKQRTTSPAPVTFSTEKIQAISFTLRPSQIRQIGGDDAKLWIEYWRGIDYLT